MKLQLLLILSIGLLFACGDNASGDVSTTKSKTQNKGQEDREYIKQSYREDGTLQSEKYIENGDLIDRVYYTNGQIKEEEIYSNISDNPDCWSAYRDRKWYENGQIMRDHFHTIEAHEPIFKNINWYENGQMRFLLSWRPPDIDYTQIRCLEQVDWNTDDMLILKEWFSNGQLKARGKLERWH